jgi:hypothetical protein
MLRCPAEDDLLWPVVVIRTGEELVTIDAASVFIGGHHCLVVAVATLLCCVCWAIAFLFHVFLLD